MLALGGKEDRADPPRNSLALKDELTGQVTVVGLDRAAHNVLREQPRALIKAIDHWINAELPAPRSKTDRFCNAIGQPPV